MPVINGLTLLNVCLMNFIDPRIKSEDDNLFDMVLHDPLPERQAAGEGGGDGVEHVGAARVAFLPETHALGSNEF